MSSRSNSRYQLAQLETKLNYSFTHPALLDQALTHKSFGKPHNERLEFLGDALLGQVIARRLYSRFPDYSEAVLTLMRAELVRGDSLAEIARDLELGRFLRLGVGEQRSGGHERASILADAFEAVLAALFLDGGEVVCEAVIDSLFAQRYTTLDNKSLKDAKTTLQEYLQGRNLPLPEYEIVQTLGVEHQRTYVVECRVESLDMCEQGEGSNRRSAEKDAAEHMLVKLSL